MDVLFEKQGNIIYSCFNMQSFFEWSETGMFFWGSNKCKLLCHLLTWLQIAIRWSKAHKFIMILVPTIWPNAVSPKSKIPFAYNLPFTLLNVNESYLIFLWLFCAVRMVNQFLSRNLLTMLLVTCICVRFNGGWGLMRKYQFLKSQGCLSLALPLLKCAARDA